MQAATHRAAANLLTLTILANIVRLLAIIHDAVDARERVGVSRVGAEVDGGEHAREQCGQHLRLPRVRRSYSSDSLGIEEDAQSIPVIGGAEHGPHPSARLCEPHCEAISVQRATLAIHAELELNLKSIGRQCQAGPEPAGLGSAVLREADVLIGVDDGAAAKVEPAIL